MLEKYNNWINVNESRINTYANHLIVIFALSMPLLISVRRLSLALILVLFMLRGRISYYVGEAIKDPVVKAFSLYFMIHILWLFGTNDYGVGKSVVHNAEFLLLPLIFSSFIDKKFILRIYSAFFIGMMASELVSYGIFFRIIAPMVHDGNQGTHFDPTPIYHHTHYGFMLATVLVLILQRLIQNKDNKATLVALLIFFISASINIFITGGRIGYVLYGVYLVMLVIFIYKRRFIKPVMIMVAMILVIFSIAYQTSQTFKERVNLTSKSVKEIVAKGDYANSIGGRLGIIVYSRELVANNWLFGLGTGDDTKAVLHEIRLKDKKLSSFFPELGHVHDEYLSALLQFGIIGLLVFLNIPFQLLRYKNPDSEMRVMFKLLGVGIIVFSFVEIFQGLGMLFTVLILTSIGLRKYVVNNAIVKDFSISQGIYYTGSIIIFYLIQHIVRSL